MHGAMIYMIYEDDDDDDDDDGHSDYDDNDGDNDDFCFLAKYTDVII